ncbi:hypothetical protein SAMN05444372_12312 [Flavobacterium micromati]|uniref:Uncharacterized protein n=1 Tax=Flavobacterium micromati TaxID=229205 RepID=A0A1M5R3I6_9FLAO|nr:hypothetical protein SAMN05444372_12312 [Flavobacterium micromati]
MMKKILLPLLFSFLFTSCWLTTGGEVDRNWQQYKPVIIDRSQLENSISFQNAQPVFKSGKIYIKV